MHFFLVGALEDGGGVGGHRAVRPQGAVGGEGGVERRGLGRLSALRAARAELVHAGGLAELLDVPQAHHAVVRVGHDVVGDLRAHHVQRTDRVLVGVCGDARPLDRHGLRSDIPQQDLTVVASSKYGGVGERIKLSRGDCGLAEAVKLRPVF